MDSRQFMREARKACTADHAPSCQATCPLHVDVRDMTAQLRADNFTHAADAFRKRVLFPRLVGHFCPAPCQEQCLRREAGGAIAIRQLEKSLFRYGDPDPFQLPPYMQLSQKVAIVGGGLSGLACALYLYEKGFQITIYEKTARLGGSGWQLDEELAAADFAFLESLTWQVYYHTTIEQEITISELCQNFDGIYLSGDHNFSAAFTVDTNTLQSQENPKIFLGGKILAESHRYSIIDALAAGRKAGISLDRFLKKVSLTASRGQEGPYETALCNDASDATVQAPVMPTLDNAYSREEAIAEANRCLDCRCHICVRQCKYLQHFEGYPGRYIREISNHISMLVGQRQSGPLIYSCSLCGLCGELCPNAIEMPQVCRLARQSLVEKGLDVPPTHDFPLRDMAFSNGEEAALWRHAPGESSSEYLFYPGCQLTANLPQHVKKVYQYLLNTVSAKTGLALGCCGAPASWSGHQELAEETWQSFLTQWEGLGRPTIITACATCSQELRQHQPDLPILSLWQIFSAYGLPEIETRQPRCLSLHDSCTARYDVETQQAVRRILNQCNVELKELTYHGAKTKCCGYGGLMVYGNRDLADEALAERAKESPWDYAVYCGACRERFRQGGKTAYHMLELIFNTFETGNPDISARRDNRRRLRQEVLAEFWREPMESLPQRPLLLTEEVAKRLADRLILTEEVAKVIELAENSGRYLLRPSDGHRIAYLRPGIITYWVEYEKVPTGYRIYNAYSHRLQLVDEDKTIVTQDPTKQGRRQRASFGHEGVEIHNDEGVICALCDEPLEPGKIVMTYMRSTFPTSILRCPSCGQCYIPEELALGKAHEVEQTLEEK